jgi:CheY-like chemotaxis protein
LKTSPRTPDAPLSVNLLADEPLLAERLALFGRRAARLRLRVSARPLPDCDAYLFPARGLPPAAELSALQASGAAVLAYGAPELLRAAFLAGCDDFLKEPWSPEELECRLERLLCARPRVVSARLSWGELSVRGGRARSPYGEARLSHSESVILAVLLSHPGEAVSREVLAYTAWGRPCAAGSRALDMQVAGLRRKLRGLAPPGPGPVEAVRIRALRGLGYVLD